MAEDEITGLNDSEMSVSIDAMVDLGKLGNSLAQAEAMVRASAQRMESSLKIGSSISGGGSGGGGIPSYSGGKISGGGSGPNFVGRDRGEYFTHGPRNSPFAGTLPDGGGISRDENGLTLTSPGTRQFQASDMLAERLTSSTDAYIGDARARTTRAWASPAAPYSGPIGPNPSGMQSLRLASSRFGGGFKRGFKSSVMGDAPIGGSASEALGQAAGEVASVAGAGIAGGVLALKAMEKSADGAASFFDASHNMDIANSNSGYRRYEAIAKAQQFLGNIPLIGSGYTAAQNLNQSLARYSPTYAKVAKFFGANEDLNFAGEKGASARATFDLSQENALGMGGFSGQRNQVNSAYENSVSDLNAQKSTIGDSLFNAQKTQLDVKRQRDVMKINLNSLYTNTDINNKTSELALDSLGLGGASRLYGTYHSYDNAITQNAVAGNTEVVNNLLRQRNVAVGAQFMSQMKPGRAASAALTGHREVSMGSMRGQDSAKFDQMLDAISRMTVTPPKIARH